MVDLLRGDSSARPCAAGKTSRSLISQRSPVEALHRDVFQIDIFEAANIDRGHSIPLRINAFSVGVNAARPAKAVLDNVLVECVRADLPFRCEQAQLFAGHEPEE
jgi:hypothetical protein